MTPSELKITRLEREQKMLVDLVSDLIDDIIILLQYADVENMPYGETDCIIEHHIKAVQVAADLIHGH